MKNYLITIYDNYIGILSTIFTDRLWIKIVSSILSFATVFIAAYLKSFDLNKLSKAHKEAANRPLIVQNEITHRYTSTISAPGMILNWEGGGPGWTEGRNGRWKIWCGWAR